MSPAPLITRIGVTKDQLGESPVWDDRTQSLYWIDSLAGLIRRLSPATGAIEEFSVPAPIGSLALAVRSRSFRPDPQVPALNPNLKRNAL